jgi:CDP-diacylglycerol---glycerol-3-phosphate 3-phosphatidyltransferase
VSAADLVAVLRALAVVPIAWAILAGADAVALAVFVVAALSDALDGWLARRSGVTARGAFLDPLADKILVVGALLALALAARGWPVTVVTILVALREGAVTLLRARALGRGIALPADRVAKAKTVLEMVGVALIIVDGRPWAVLGAGIVGLAFVLSLLNVPRYLSR